jgi:hypothetical protein
MNIQELSGAQLPTWWTFFLVGLFGTAFCVVLIFTGRALWGRRTKGAAAKVKSLNLDEKLSAQELQISNYADQSEHVSRYDSPLWRRDLDGLGEMNRARTQSRRPIRAEDIVLQQMAQAQQKDVMISEESVLQQMAAAQM